MRTVTLFTRPGCHLCDRAKDVIARCQGAIPFQLQVVDIALDPALEARYGHDIPVILLDGVEIARHFVRERHLLELLRKP